MNVRAKRAVWLLVLGALLSFEVRPRTHQLAGGAAQSTPSDEVTLRVIVVDSAEEAQRIVTRLNGGEDFIALAQAESIDPTAECGRPPGQGDAVDVAPGVERRPRGRRARAAESGGSDPHRIRHPEGGRRHRSGKHQHERRQSRQPGDGGEREIRDRRERHRGGGGDPAGISQTRRLEPGSARDLPGAPPISGVVAEVARRFPVA